MSQPPRPASLLLPAASACLVGATTQACSCLRDARLAYVLAPTGCDACGRDVAGWLSAKCAACCAENPLPDPSFIISIESFTVTHGQMVRVPNFYYQASGAG
jgi:hypothetical protein